MDKYLTACCNADFTADLASFTCDKCGKDACVYLPKVHKDIDNDESVVHKDIDCSDCPINTPEQCPYQNDGRSNHCPNRKLLSESINGRKQGEMKYEL